MNKSALVAPLILVIALGLWALPSGRVEAGSGPVGGPPTGNVNPTNKAIPPVPLTAAQQQLLVKKEAIGTRLEQLWNNYISGRMTWAQYLSALPNQGTPQRPNSVTPFSSSQTILSPFSYVVQQCNNYCGPATSYEIGAYYHGCCGWTLYSQQQWAAAEGTGGSGGQYNTSTGTCISAIRNSLNSYTGGVWTDYHATSYGDYSSHMYNDIYYSSQPVGNLVNPNPPDGTPYALVGYYGGPTNIIHYVATYGYSGNYNGSDSSQTVYYADSNNACCSGNHTVSTNAMADTIMYNNGTGGCDGNNDINY